MGEIDRIAPTRRPRGMPVMFQRWEELLFCHWDVDPAALRALLPPELELDTFEGRAFVGLVPFAMVDVRPSFVPPFRPLSDFLETNVRTYVHYKGRDPGVWFFSLDAANSVAVRLARAWYKLPYHRSDMQMSRDLQSNVYSYRSERRWPEPVPATLRARYEVVGPIEPAKPGTLEHFLAERYVLYAKADERLYLGRVHHVPYPLQAARVLELDESLLRAAKIPRPAGPPPLQHYASGVDVDVWSLEPIVGA
jgi:uncharacterized protein YqjF (DUF2071 family)